MPQVVGKKMIQALLPIVHHSQHVPGSGANPLVEEAAVWPSNLAVPVEPPPPPAPPKGRSKK